jgi:phenylacetate-CoA ligase
LVIVEPVDQAERPVPPGTIGARPLVTVLFSSTLPLIRYEMSDSVGVGGRGCPCGRSFALLTEMQERVEDVLLLPGIAGEVSVQPNVFHNVLDEATIAGWQVVQRPAALRAMLAGLAPSASVEQVRAGLESALTSSGVLETNVDVQVVDAVERTALGKAQLVQGLGNRP